MNMKTQGLDGRGLIKAQGQNVLMPVRAWQCSFLVYRVRGRWSLGICILCLIQTYQRKAKKENAGHFDQGPVRMHEGFSMSLNSQLRVFLRRLVLLLKL